MYLTLTLDGGSAYRSEILNGAMVLGADSLRAWGGADITCTLVVERVPYWEGAAVTLVNAQTITNADGSNSYYTATAVTGTLPAPCKITIKNNGLLDFFRYIHIGCNAFNAPATFDGTLGTKTLTITSPVTFATDAASWTPSSADLIAMGGDYFRFVGAFAGGLTSGVSYRMEISTGTIVLGKTEEVYAADADNFDVVDFGAMAMPPIIGGVAAADSYISINAYSAATNGSDTLSFVQMFPADNYRLIRTSTTATANAEITDDGIEGAAYTVVSSTNRPNVQVYGNPIMVYPGQAHRFSLLTENTAYSATIEQLLTVSYRPRRLTI